MKTVKAGTQIIGQGMPKICVPIPSRTPGEAFVLAGEIKSAGADLAELRADYLSLSPGDAEYTEFLAHLKEQLGEVPLLFTWRTKAEGGVSPERDALYAQAVREAMRSGVPELIDLELSSPCRKALSADLSGSGIAVIFSEHHFHETPSKEKLVETFLCMEEAGADIAKIAVMPKSEENVETLLCAAEEAHARMEIPLIAISMGEMGEISRIAGEYIGSVITFGSLGEGSAPGQIPVPKLRRILEYVHVQRMNGMNGRDFLREAAANRQFRG